MSRTSSTVSAFAAACLLLVIVAVHAGDRNAGGETRRNQRDSRAAVHRPRIDFGASYDPAYDPNANRSPAEDAEPDDNPIDIETFLDGLTVHLREATRLGALSREERYLRRALERGDDDELRARIEADVGQLAGPPTFPASTVAPAFGLDDSCEHAIPVGLPGSVTMSIQPPIFIPGIGVIEDRNFLSFDVPLVEPGTPHEPLIGSIVRVESSACDAKLVAYAGCRLDGRGKIPVMGCPPGFICLDDPLCSDEGEAIDGLGACFDSTGRNSGERCLVDEDCQLSQGGPQSHAFCANAVCLSPGTYYIEVTGKFDSSPQNFDVSVRTIGTCPVPRADGYEADDSGRDAVPIGWPHSIPGNGNGRASKEIQSHTLLAYCSSGGIDTDYVKVELSRDELVRFSTAVTQPRPSNGYFYRPASHESDTEMHAQYADGTFGQAGVCNHNSSFRGGSFVDLGCRSTQTNFGILGLGPDEDPNGCMAAQAPRFFNVPSNWCIPNYLVTAFLTQNFPGPDVPFIFHDDNDPGGIDFGSTIELCLPAAGQSTQPTNPIVARVTSSAANPRSPLLNYFYETRAQTLTPCTFEREPNQTPFEASPIGIDQEVFGLNDTATTRRANAITPVRRCAGGTTPSALCYEVPRPPGPNRFAILDICGGGGTCTANISATPVTGVRTSAVSVAGFHDFDWWGPFNVAVETDVILTLAPQIIDFEADTSLSLRVGPADTDGDGFDDFPLVAEDVNTSTSSPPSTLEWTLLPAARYLANRGILGRDPRYYLVAGILTNRGDGGSSIPDHYYRLSISSRVPLAETEPNDDCLTTPQTAEVGDAWQGSLYPSGGKYLSRFGIIADCDIDAYRVSVTENTRISFLTEGDPVTTDTAIQLEDCTTGTVIACDEDGQTDTNGTYWSMLEGCLPPGNYCVRVRAWSGLGPEFGFNEFYKITFEGTPGCDPFSDPVVGDGASSCRVDDSRGPFDSFCDGDGDGSPARTACGVPLE